MVDAANEQGRNGERSGMATAKTHIRRIAAAGALAVAALTGPALAALGGSATNSATGNCLAWFGSRDDGICMGYSNGQPTYIGTPQGGWLGPGYGTGVPGSSSGGFGVTTGPLLPGQTFTKSVG
jgi:hypothetical protein